MCILDVLELYKQVHTCQNIPSFTGLFQRDFVLHMMIAVEALKYEASIAILVTLNFDHEYY